MRQRGYYKGATKEAIKDIFEVIAEALVRGDKVWIKNFGVFETKVVKGHAARDPITNEIRPYEDYEKPNFRPSETLRSYVKQSGRLEAEERKIFAADLYSQKGEEEEDEIEQAE